MLPESATKPYDPSLNVDVYAGSPATSGGNAKIENVKSGFCALKLPFSQDPPMNIAASPLMNICVAVV